MSPDEVATRAKMKEAGYSEEEIQTMIDAGCTEMAWIFMEKFSTSHYCSVITSAMFYLIKSMSEQFNINLH